MKKANLILAGLIALTMVSCQEVPEDVKSRTEDRNSAIEEAKNHSDRTGEIIFISPSELEEDIKAGLSQTYSNFTLADGIKVDVPETIVKCDFKQVEGYDVKAEMLCEKIFGKEVADSIQMQISLPNPDAPYQVESKGFRNDDKQLHFSLANNGFLCFMREGLYENMGSVGQRVGIYHVDRGDDLSDTYMLDGKEVSVAEAVEAAQKWLDDNYADLEPDYDVRVKTVIAREDYYGEQALEFKVERVYKGVKIDELIFVHYKEVEKKDQIKYREYPLMMITKNGTDIDYLSNLTGIVAPIEKGTLDKVVSLKSALEYMEKTFADFETPLTINDINLKYVMTPEYNVKNWMSYQEENVFSTGRIMWEFVIDVPMEQLGHIENGEMVYNSSSIGDIRKYIYIDAETGELEFEFELNVLGQ